MSDNYSRLLDLAHKLDCQVPLAGMINPDAWTCRYAARELLALRSELAELRAQLAMPPGADMVPESAQTPLDTPESVEAARSQSSPVANPDPEILSRQVI